MPRVLPATACSQRRIQLLQRAYGTTRPGKFSRPCSSILWAMTTGSPSPGKQREQPAGVEPGEPQHPGGHRIETFEGEQEPAVQICLTAGPLATRRGRSLVTSATAVRHTQASSPRDRQCWWISAPSKPVSARSSS